MSDDHSEYFLRTRCPDCSQFRRKKRVKSQHDRAVRQWAVHIGEGCSDWTNYITKAHCR